MPKTELPIFGFDSESHRAFPASTKVYNHGVFYPDLRVTRRCSEAAIDAAKILAVKHRCIVCVSGKVDFVTDGKRIVSIHNGHPLMSKVTGLGCTATALIGPGSFQNLFLDALYNLSESDLRSRLKLVENEHAS